MDKKVTILLQSGDLDRALSAFILANGYAALGADLLQVYRDAVGYDAQFASAKSACASRTVLSTSSIMLCARRSRSCATSSCRFRCSHRKAWRTPRDTCLRPRAPVLP